MSLDQLIWTEPNPIQRAVSAALTGLPIPDVATQYGMEPTNLSDAVAVYDQAGREALARHAATTEWWQAYLHFTDWTDTDTTFTAHVLPVLQEAEAAGAIGGWWYTRKHPCWRLRLRLQPEPETKLPLGDSFDRLVSDGHLQRWWPGIYELETAAFGGPASMTAAHALFVTDSREAPQLRQRRDLTLGPRELSVLLCTIMMRAAGLEWYEQGDVWHHVITEEHRSAVSDVPADRLDARAQEIRPLLFADSDVLLRPGGLLEPVAEWAAAFRTTGQQLRHAVQAGTLDRGLRQVLSYHVIFHWNRLGLSMRGQSILAWAARAAILHGESGA
ncbi:thiopeptide-type bacteriocin biosynthesis protein [Streptomyces sp. NBC_00264]|uniref:thiopeptide-type bacteriocin biosynthesis protein n=1 Tax=unclassified Streptomyces TaxID=2593676 RepID=UPI00225BAA45|nr:MULTISPECIES: thiopeptide-type bacteriocin biosynthesis protein [unclassified Streptomyces]MCX5163713.1 thiopeptide-type bacteriocin biosynthesis protein [Streptomyces sp. NBC_00305]MCX5222236.1 thiopeptide-type bacteriocin biosynthesis protein [Streptomyces sp. NBC_00264]